MTNEEKQLLLKDLCVRLPYNLWVCYEDKNYLITGYGHGRVSLLPSIFSSATGPCPLIDEVKPYLRPLSSMTEEEEIEFVAIGSIVSTYGIHNYYCILSFDELDWLNAHHFDYRGLIEMSLALEAPEGMYKF